MERRFSLLAGAAEKREAQEGLPGTRGADDERGAAVRYATTHHLRQAFDEELVACERRNRGWNSFGSHQRFRAWVDLKSRGGDISDVPAAHVADSAQLANGDQAHAAELLLNHPELDDSIGDREGRIVGAVATRVRQQDGRHAGDGRLCLERVKRAWITAP